MMIMINIAVHILIIVTIVVIALIMMMIRGSPEALQVPGLVLCMCQQGGHGGAVIPFGGLVHAISMAALWEFMGTSPAQSHFFYEDCGTY